MKDLLISFSFKRRRVLIHKSTLRALNLPQNIRFLLNTEKRCMAVQSCAPIDRDNFAVPDLSTVYQYEITSISFLDIVYKLAKWDNEKTYRVIGLLYPVNQLVEFRLSEAMQISDDEFIDDDL